MFSLFSKNREPEIEWVERLEDRLRDLDILKKDETLGLSSPGLDKWINVWIAKPKESDDNS